MPALAQDVGTQRPQSGRTARSRPKQALRRARPEPDERVLWLLSLRPAATNAGTCAFRQRVALRRHAGAYHNQIALVPCARMRSVFAATHLNDAEQRSGDERGAADCGGARHPVRLRDLHLALSP
jgi:hypothetical protein